jgi:hypothetical protein
MLSPKKERILWKISREAQEATRLKIESLFQSQATVDPALQPAVVKEMKIILDELTAHLVDVINTDGRIIRKAP